MLTRRLGHGLDPSLPSRTASSSAGVATRRRRAPFGDRHGRSVVTPGERHDLRSVPLPLFDGPTVVCGCHDAPVAFKGSNVSAEGQVTARGLAGDFMRDVEGLATCKFARLSSVDRICAFLSTYFFGFIFFIIRSTKVVPELGLNSSSISLLAFSTSRPSKLKLMFGTSQLAKTSFPLPILHCSSTTSPLPAPAFSSSPE
jgi:hypothetical protein